MQTSTKLQEYINESQFDFLKSLNYFEIDHYWAKGSNNPDRGDYDRSIKVKIEDVEKIAEKSENLGQFEMFIWDQFSLSKMFRN